MAAIVQLEQTCTNNTAMPNISPFLTVVLIPTAGHIDRASLKIGFSFNRPFRTSSVLDFLVANLHSSVGGLIPFFH